MKEAQKLFQVILAVFIIKVDYKSDRSDIEDLNFLGLAVNLQILDQLVFGTDLFIEFEVIDYSLLRKRPHLFIVMAIFIKNPLEVRYSFSWFYLFPYLPLKQYLSNQVFVVIAFHNMESQLIIIFGDSQLLLCIICRDLLALNSM